MILWWEQQNCKGLPVFVCKRLLSRRLLQSASAPLILRKNSSGQNGSMPPSQRPFLSRSIITAVLERCS